MFIYNIEEGNKKQRRLGGGGEGGNRKAEICVWKD
jgi:hypothetical protein